MRGTLLLALSLLPGAALAEVLNYDYVYLSKNGTESDTPFEKGDGVAAGGFKSFRKHTHFFLSYDDNALYAGTNPNWDYDLKTWRIGAGGHYLIGKRTMIAPALSVFRSHGEAMAPGWDAPRQLRGTGYVAQVDLRHAFNDHLEATLAARRSQSQSQSSNEFVGGMLYHLNDTWAVGVLYHDRDPRPSTEFTVRYYY